MIFLWELYARLRASGCVLGREGLEGSLLLILFKEYKGNTACADALGRSSLCCASLFSRPSVRLEISVASLTPRRQNPPMRSLSLAAASSCSP